MVGLQPLKSPIQKIWVPTETIVKKQTDDKVELYHNWREKVDQYVAERIPYLFPQTTLRTRIQPVLSKCALYANVGGIHMVLSDVPSLEFCIKMHLKGQKAAYKMQNLEGMPPAPLLLEYYCDTLWVGTNPPEGGTHNNFDLVRHSPPPRQDDSDEDEDDNSRWRQASSTSQ